MGNLDFGQQPLFSVYSLFLLASGVILIATVLIPRLDKGNRAANAIFGVLFGGYGYYLIFLSHGGSYFVFIYALVLPIGLIVATFRSLMENRGGKVKISAQQQAYLAQQQANQAQYVAWQQAQAHAQTQNWQQSGVPAQSWPQAQTQAQTQVQAQAQPQGQTPGYPQQQGFPAPAPAPFSEFSDQAPAQARNWQLPPIPAPSAVPAPAAQQDDTPSL
jgi:hypothetical protein